MFESVVFALAVACFVGPVAFGLFPAKRAQQNAQHVGKVSRS